MHVKTRVTNPDWHDRESTNFFNETIIFLLIFHKLKKKKQKPFFFPSSFSVGWLPVITQSTVRSLVLSLMSCLTQRKLTKTHCTIRAHTRFDHFAYAKHSGNKFSEHIHIQFILISNSTCKYIQFNFFFRSVLCFCLSNPYTAVARALWNLNRNSLRYFFSIRFE